MNSTQRLEVISMLETAALNGLDQLELELIAKRYVWNAYRVRASTKTLIPMCAEARRKAGH